MFYLDRDECRESQQLCQYTCINTEGSYRCVCPSGMYSPETRKYQCLGEFPLNMIYAFEMYIWYLVIKHNSVIIYTKCQCRHWYSWPCPLSQPIPCLYLLQTLMSVWTAMEGALTSASTHSAPTSAPAPREWLSKQMGRRVSPVCRFLLNFQFSTWLCMLTGGAVVMLRVVCRSTACTYTYQLQYIFSTNLLRL